MKSLLTLLVATQALAQSLPILRATDIVSVPGRPIHEAASAPGSRRVYYLAEGDSLWMFDRDTKRSTLVARISGAYNLNVSHAGDRIAVARSTESGKGEHIWTLALNSSGLAAGSPKRISISDAEYPAISPDGKQIAYAAYDSAASRLVITSIDGGPERTLTSSPLAWAAIHWSGDGKWIYFNERRARPDGWRTQYRIPTAGGAAEKLGMTGTAYPGLSPDGRFLLFEPATRENHALQPRKMIIGDPQGKPIGAAMLPSNGWDGWSSNTSIINGMDRLTASLRIMPVSGGPSRLIDSTLAVTAHAWSPDGKRFAVLGQKGAQGVIVFFNADGSGRRAISIADSGLSPVRWSPDGKLVMYRRAGDNAVRMIDVASGAPVNVIANASDTAGFITDQDAYKRPFGYTNSLGDSTLRRLPVDLGGAPTSFVITPRGKDSVVIRTIKTTLHANGNAMLGPVMVPGQRKAVLSSLDEGTRSIHVLDLDTGNTTLLVTLSPRSERPVVSVSPDGKQLLYTQFGTATGVVTELNLASVLKR